MKKLCVAFSLGMAGMLFGQTVERDVGDPGVNRWKENQWVSATGGWAASEERAPDAPAGGRTLRATITYPAKTFAQWGFAPEEKTMPGRVEKISAWTRAAQRNCAAEIVVKDAAGNERKFGLPADAQRWRFTEIAIPADLQQPLTFEGILFHNWGEQNHPEDAVVVMDICDLRVSTDISTVPLAQRPYGVALKFPAHANIFYSNEKPIAHFSAHSWLGDERTLNVKARVVSSNGDARDIKAAPVRCRDAAFVELEMPFAEPGAYTLEVEVNGFPEPQKVSSRYVVCLPPPALTDAQKMASPYGINIHGGTFVDHARFARLGFVWLRDYAFNYEWLVNARGDGNYAGWPWYPKLLKAARDNGLLTLPCLMGSLLWNPRDPDSPETPTAEWRRQIALAVATFSELTCWELDNEAEFRMPADSAAFANYHAALGEIVRAAAPKAWVVEQGNASMPAELTRKNVLSGAFKNIDVVNGHHYCGVYAPEINTSNANTGQGEAKQAYLRDIFRHWKNAAQADGKARQAWLTELGWDTRAGQIVTEWEQAAYLQRGYMLALAHGIDKIFWFSTYDADTDNPQNFFDGCGLFDRFREPKPATAAFSAMRAFLPADMKYVGYALPADNAMVQIFEVNGSLVAAAFKLDPEGAECEIAHPAAKAIYDMYGAPVIARGRHKLNIAPTWYIGLDRASPWFAHAAMDVTSDHFVRNVAGENIRITTTQTGAYNTRVPDGWKVAKTAAGFDVTTPPAAPRGPAAIFVDGVNNGQTKTMRVDVDIVPEAFARAFAVGADNTFKVDVVNQSSSRKTHTLAASLPAGWEVTPAQQSTTLDPEEKTTLTFTLAKSSPISATETKNIPQMLVQNAAGEKIDAVPIVPREWRLGRVQKIALDGDLSDWPATTRMPGWMLGPRGTREATALYMGYADDGLYFGLDVVDSKCRASDPRLFWNAADCFEIVFMPEFNSGPNYQFWFCPLPAENRAFAGFWSRVEGLPTLYDIPDIKSFVKQNDTGYTMEIFIPASRINGFKPQSGATAGLTFSLAVQGKRDNREIFWPSSKHDGHATTPWMWGRVVLE